MSNLNDNFLPIKVSMSQPFNLGFASFNIVGEFCSDDISDIKEIVMLQISVIERRFRHHAIEKGAEVDKGYDNAPQNDGDL